MVSLILSWCGTRRQSRGDHSGNMGRRQVAEVPAEQDQRRGTGLFQEACSEEQEIIVREVSEV